MRSTTVLPQSTGYSSFCPVELVPGNVASALPACRAEHSRFIPRNEVPPVEPGSVPSSSSRSICACEVTGCPSGLPGGSVSGICLETAAYRSLSVGTWIGCCGQRSTEYMAIRIGNCSRTGQHPEKGLTPYSLYSFKIGRAHV